MRNWSLVFTGNFAGALTVAVFMAIIFTNGFHDAPNAIGQKIGHIGEGRTVGLCQAGKPIPRRQAPLVITNTAVLSSITSLPSGCS